MCDAVGAKMAKHKRKLPTIGLLLARTQLPEGKDQQQLAGRQIQKTHETNKYL
jgi:hypothetical protein